MTHTKHIISFFLGSLLLVSCGIYSFTGASIAPDIESVSVQYFPNKAATIQPTLSQVFTERLKDYFLEQTNLNLTEDNGDLMFSGSIVKYQIKPMAIGSNEIAGKNRLTISVQVTFKNQLDKSKNFDQSFSRYRDYDSNYNISDVENSLIEEITNELAEDIFNKAVVNW